MTNQRIESIWDVICETPGHAVIMRMRSELMCEIQKFIKDKSLSQAEAAELLGLTQPRVSDINRGRLSKFNLETLIGLAERCGLTFELHKSRVA